MPEFIVDEETGTPINNSTILIKSIPAQLPSDVPTKILKTGQNPVKTTMTAVMITSMAVNLVL